MNATLVWILVSVSSVGGGSSGFAVPAFSPAVATEADCLKLMDAAQRVVKAADGRSKAPVMECVAVNVPVPKVAKGN